MELTLERWTLEKLLDHAASAARLVGHIDEDVPGIVVGPLADHIDAMVHDLSEMLGMPRLIGGSATGDRAVLVTEAALAVMGDEGGVRMTRRGLGSGDSRFDVANAVDELRQLVARADALVHATEDLFERFIWGDEGDDNPGLEHLAHLMGATIEAVRAAMAAGDRIALDLTKHRART
jgi:glycosyltransferase involved in cell wall biosynthesis